MKPPALVFSGQRWSAEQALTATMQRRAHMRAEIDASERIASFSADPHPDTVWSFFAALSLGAVALPVPSTTTESLRASYDAAAEAPATPETRLRLLTSGSTGAPKRIDLTALQLSASAEASRARLGCSADDTWLCCLPLNHIAGLSILLRTGAAGATAHLLPRFDAAEVSQAIDNDGITMISLVPTMLRRVLDARDERTFPSTLRVILLGGAPAQDDLMERCRRIQAPVALTWGMSETASQIATRTPGDLRPAADVGQPLPGHRVFVKDGRLGVEGPIAPDGRMLTSDRGHLDEHGRVVVEGRGEALIISGGENVDPHRVGDVLRTHPSVTEAVILGMPDPVWGERVCAVLTGVRDDDLSEWLRTHLEPHERPRQVVWVESLPRNAMGKVQRTTLRELLQTA